EVGKDADLIVTDGDVLHFMTQVHQAIVNGKVAYEKEKDTLFAHIRPTGAPIVPEFDDVWPRRLEWPSDFAGSVLHGEKTKADSEKVDESPTAASQESSNQADAPPPAEPSPASQPSSNENENASDAPSTEEPPPDAPADPPSVM
ncbi:MAG: hypothetical protein AB7N71_12510, partial [Phycisphaerae bacterium]